MVGFRCRTGLYTLKYTLGQNYHNFRISQPMSAFVQSVLTSIAGWRVPVLAGRRIGSSGHPAAVGGTMFGDKSGQ